MIVITLLTYNHCLIIVIKSKKKSLVAVKIDKKDNKAIRCNYHSLDPIRIVMVVLTII